MSKNNNLNIAYYDKRDEFYTLYEDIEKEIQYYEKYLKNKIVYCNCDNPLKSNFFKYFELNFDYLKIKKLISTCCQTSFQKPIKSIVTSKKKTLSLLKDNGSFDSDECISLLKESDIVITNPPFSLFRKYLQILINYNKKFIIIGNQNAITYKEVFKLFIDNKIRIGKTFPKKFIIPNEYNNRDNIIIKKNEKNIARFGNICWFTNLELEDNHRILDLKKNYNIIDYPKYENYNAINVNKVVDIPYDYDGIMGVPISFINKYNPEQFEIIMLANGNARYSTSLDILNEVGYIPDKRDRGGLGIINNKVVYARILIKNKIDRI